MFAYQIERLHILYFHRPIPTVNFQMAAHAAAQQVQTLVNVSHKFRKTINRTVLLQHEITTVNQMWLIDWQSVVCLLLGDHKPQWRAHSDLASKASGLSTEWVLHFMFAKSMNTVATTGELLLAKKMK